MTEPAESEPPSAGDELTAFFPRTEGAMSSAAHLELPALTIAESASEMLRWVLDRAQVTAYDGDGKPPAKWWRAKAMLYLGVIGVRSARCAMLVVSAGYQKEALAHTRSLTECHGRLRKVYEDQSGSYAEEWLRARAGKPAKAVGVPDYWDTLSQASHADHRGVELFLAVSLDDGGTSLNVGPERRPGVSNATLSMVAGECRDLAHVIALERGLTIPRLDMLDAAIKELHAVFVPDADEPEQAVE